jgi:hypothetical protein
MQAPVERRTAALRYARRGLKVFPLHAVQAGLCTCGCADPGCNDRGKHPRTEHGFLDATTDSDTICEWFDRWSSANLAIATGAASGILVIDIDPRHGGDASWERLKAELGDLPDTWTVRTGTGTHVYYRLPEGVSIRSSVGRLGAGIDVKADGGYVVAPPSVHANGAQYGWEGGDETIAQPPALVPPALLQRLVQVETESRPRVDDGEKVPEGTRNTYIFSLGCGMRGGGAPDCAIDAALQAVNAALCDPPLTPQELENITARVKRFKPGDIKAHRDPGNTASTTGPSGVQSARDLLAAELTPPRVVVERLLTEGITLIVGKPKTGKSLLVLGIGTAVTLGGYALGRLTVERGKVLYLALEDGEKRVQTRLRDLLGGNPTPEGLFIATKWDPLDKGGLNALKDWLNAHPDTRLIIIDTLKRVRPQQTGAQRIYDADYEALAPLADLAHAYGVAVLVVHHTRKTAAEDPMDLINASTGLGAAADTVLVLSRQRNAASATLTVMSRDLDESELTLAWDPTLHSYCITETPDFPSRRQPRENILRVLREAQERLTPSQVADQLGEKYENVKALLHKMKLDREVCAEDGRYWIPGADPGSGSEPSAA